MARPTSPPEKPTRDRILAAAARLFQAQGVRATSVDAVADLAGVTKRTLYYHFRSKDDLIAAHLEGRDEPNLSAFRRWAADAPAEGIPKNGAPEDGTPEDGTPENGTPVARIAGLFHGLSRAVRHPKWKGCGFLRTAVELNTLPGHPAILAARRHKHGVEDWLTGELSPPLPPDAARTMAQQICLLIDGGFSLVMLHRDPAYMDRAGEAAVALVRGALPRSTPSETQVRT